MSDAPEHRQSASTMVSNGLSKLHRDHYGRSADSVRTIIGHDHVVTFLEDLFTPLERTLVAAGETDAVREVRRAFQRAMKDRFIAVVEEATGRTVRGFLSEVCLEPDISAEVFVLDRLHPDPNPAPEGIA